jgi:N-acetylglutamate synthase-like GNAT family acetyltransferase
MIEIRPAKSTDVKGIRKLIDTYAPARRLLSKETVTLYESVQEFTVAIEDGEVIGCGALHVLWEDLAEVRTVAVAEKYRQSGIGHRILEAVIDRAREIGVKRIFSRSRQVFLAVTVSRRSRAPQWIPRFIPSCFTPTTQESPNSSTLRVSSPTRWAIPEC